MHNFIHTLWDVIYEWYWIPLFILYAGLISTILIENRNPSKTIAWILVIVFLPFIGIIWYYLFGQKFKKVQDLKRDSEEQAQRLRYEFRLMEPQIRDSLEEIGHRIGKLVKVYQYVKNQEISLPSQQNAVTLLRNGGCKFKDLLHQLSLATHSIHMEYYIFEPDNIGLKILHVLERKAQEGVEVRLLVDAFGSPAMVRYMRKHVTAILFQEFLPVNFSSLANSNYRNHRKICVIDGKTAYVGGINVSDRYINPSPDGVYWRDTAIRMAGPAVGLLQISFWTSWNQTGSDSFPLREPYLTSTPEARGNATLSLAGSDPGSAAPYALESLLIAIAGAERSIQLCTPYYIPGEELERALLIASASGVQVELLIPAKGDSWVVQHATYSFLKPLLQRGIKVYLYERGFMHAKTVHIDGKLAFVGTVNLDIRSFYINYEITAILADDQLCGELERQFEADKRDSTLLTMENWLQRPRWKRGVDSLCRLLAPLL